MRVFKYFSNLMASAVLIGLGIDVSDLLVSIMFIMFGAITLVAAGSQLYQIYGEVE